MMKRIASCRKKSDFDFDVEMGDDGFAAYVVGLAADDLVTLEVDDDGGYCYC